MPLAARQRIARVVEAWLFAEPLLLSAWTSHSLVADPRLQTIRVQRGRIEYNPQFIDQLTPRELEMTLRFEAVRILLKHPYSRRQPQPALSYAASNVTIQEYLQTDLPFPRAADLFNHHEYDRQYFEFYYHKLLELLPPWSFTSPGSGDGEAPDEGEGIPNQDTIQALSDRVGSAQAVGKPTGSLALAAYRDPGVSGWENASLWDQDDLLVEHLDDLIQTAYESNSWGSIKGRLRERILANLRPKLDYRSILRQFRTSILSQNRRLTRMKPSRRYGFDYMGSRREFSTRLLFAVDVSGSMGTDQLRAGFSVINRFFNYGVPHIDVLQFDTEVRGPVLTLRKARQNVVAQGRGGTNFTPVLAYIDEHREYDGAIIFTDGYAPTPERRYTNRHTRILWLFVHEGLYRSCYPQLRHLGLGAFLKPSAVSTRKPY